jgi:dissimilatory sulfite reductase (desulfoviridin) alpha/beta subunit
LDVKLTDEEKRSRIDIRYRTAGGKHIIIELKKYDAHVNIHDLVKQIAKYKQTLEKCLKDNYSEDDNPIEIICLLGKPPSPKSKENIELLKVYNARYITYDQLIKETIDSYQDYLDKQKKISNIVALIEKI